MYLLIRADLILPYPSLGQADVLIKSALMYGN